MPLDCLILAAGAASRFGACKLLAEWHGRPLIQCAIEATQVVNPQRLLVVAGAYCEQLRSWLDHWLELTPHIGTAPELLYCPDWDRGMGHSLAFGVSQLPAGNSLLVVLADQPLVRGGDLQQLFTQSQRTPHHIVCARFGDTLSAPALFPPECKSALRALQDDRGAKALFAAHPDLLCSLPLAAAEFDVDTPADLARLLQESPYDFAHD